MSKRYLLLWLWLTLLVAPESVERAALFEQDSDDPNPVFTFERKVTSNETGSIVDVEFRTPDGTVAVSEQVVYENGAVVRYEQIQNQLNHRYLMTVSGDQARFDVRRDGDVSHSRSKWTPDTLIIDQIRPFISTHWDRLMQGQSVPFRLVALERTRIVDFKLKHDESITYRGSPAELLQMQAGNFFVRWFAPRVELILSPDGKTLLESRGPVPVKVRHNGSWEDLEARLVWER